MSNKETYQMNIPTGVGKELIEGHPLGVSKIIQGDLREITFEVEGATHTVQKTDGTLLYDRQKSVNRPWFVIAYESGRRIVD